MNVDIITIFPDQVRSFMTGGIFNRAKESGVDLEVHDLRKWTDDKHRTVDDRPFGGGPGMVMKVEPIYKAVEEIKTDSTHVIITTPRGKNLNSAKSKEIARHENILIICGHYEGVDERVHRYIADEGLSIGNYVLSGGELPALVIVDSVLRHVPGVLGNPESLIEESCEDEMEQEYPQYTRPEEFNGWKVPDILLSGDHKKIKEWRNKQSN